VNGMMALGIVMSLKDKLSGPARKVMDSLKGIEKAAELGRRIRGRGLEMQGIGALWNEIGQRGAGAMRAFMGEAYDLDDALASVRTISSGTFGSVEADVQAVSKAAREWALTWSDSATDFARSSYMMLSAGLDTRQSIAGTETALAVARATMGDATQAASLLATIYNNLGDRTADARLEMARLGDVVTRTQQAFKIADLGQLSEGLKYAVPSAKAFGISLEQVSAVVGKLNDAGLEGSMAGTALSATMRQMLKASKDLGFEVVRTASGGVDLVATFEMIERSFGSFGAMSDEMKGKFQKAFGEEGVRSMQLLLGNTQALRSGLDAVSNATGVTTSSQKVMESTGAAAWRNLANHVSELKFVIAQDLGPALYQIIDGLKSAVGGVKDFVQAHPDLSAFAAKWLVLGVATLAVVGPLTMVMGFLTQTAGLFIGAYASMFKFGAYLKTTLVPWLGTAAATIKGALMTSLVAVKGALITAATAAWSFAAALLANPITWIVAGVAALGVGIYQAVKHWDELKVALYAADRWIRDAFGALGDWFGRLWDGIAGAAGQAMEGVKGAVGSAWAWVKDSFNGILSWIDGLGARMWDSGVGLFEAFVGGIKHQGAKVVGAVRDVLSWVRDLLPFSDARFGPLSTLTASGRAFTETWASGVKDAIPSLERSLVGVTSTARRVVDAHRPPDAGAAAEWLGRSTQAKALNLRLAEAGGARDRDGRARGARSVIIQRLTLNVNASDARDADAFGRMISGLAEQHA
jgi:TP901 family phage tail tape measure protein